MDIQQLVQRASETVNISRAFGPAIERDGVTIIPVGVVVGGGGGGSGGPASDGDPSAIDGTGEGGGFGTLSYPFGAYIVKDGHVRWMPAIDGTRVLLAAVGVAKLAMKLRAVRRTRS